MHLIAGLDAQTMETIVLGGAVLGCGGGGKLEDGLSLGEAATACGGAQLVVPAALPEQAALAAVMPVHTSGFDTYPIYPQQTRRALALLQEQLGTAVAGLVNGGLGAVESVIGWELSASMRIPLLDGGIPATFHPVSLRNLLAFWQETAPLETFCVSLASRQENDRRGQEQRWRAQPGELLRQLDSMTTAASESFVAAAGPLSLADLQRAGSSAPVSHALQVGKELLAVNDGGGAASVAALRAGLPCPFSTFATVTALQWYGQGQDGYGHITMRDVANRHLQLTYGQRYQALTADGQQIAAFPDLIITLGTLGTPLTGEEVFEGQDVYLLVAPQPAA